jgi:hypothetical protein
MVKGNRKEINRSLDKPVSDTSSARSASRINPSNNADEIIVTLADAYENKRARQVTEWERTQPLYLRQTA